jgi:ankyrin repeat protein
MEDNNANSRKKIKLGNENEDNEIWNSINLNGLDIKALYQYIKSKGNSCQVTDKDGYSLLYLAAYNRNMEALRILLLQPDVDVNVLNGSHHELAIHAACSQDLPDAVELLIENGSQLDTKDSLGHTPLFNAIFACSLECVELLLKTGKDIDASIADNLGNTLLHISASRDFAKAIPLLTQCGIPVDHQNQRGLSPLAVAISLGNLEAATALIGNGADVNGRTKFATVLHHAVTWNRIEIVEKLVKLNCNVNVVNLLEETPLYLAVQQRKIDIVKYLIEEADANPCFSLDPSNNTNLPLLYAANHGYTELSKYLVTSNTTDFSIRSSMDMAKRAGFPATEEFLKKQLEERNAKTENTANAENDKGEEDNTFTSLFNTFSDEE